jgi:hypothetical protein
LISIPHGEEPRSGVSNHEARLGPHPSFETRAMRAPQDEEPQHTELLAFGGNDSRM